MQNGGHCPQHQQRDVEEADCHSRHPWRGTEENVIIPNTHEEAQSKRVINPNTHREARRNMVVITDICGDAQRKEVVLPDTHGEARRNMVIIPDAHGEAGMENIVIHNTHREAQMNMVVIPNAHGDIGVFQVFPDAVGVAVEIFLEDGGHRPQCPQIHRSVKRCSQTPCRHSKVDLVASPADQDPAATLAEEDC